MENTNESTNLRKLESLLSGTSPQKRCRCHSNHCSPNHCSHIGHPNQLQVHIVSGAQSCRKMSVFTKLHGQKPSKSSSESESGVHCCHAAVKKCKNLRKWSNKLVESVTIQLEMRKRSRQTCAEINCGRRRQRHRMQRHRFMCAVK